MGHWAFRLFDPREAWADHWTWTARRDMPGDGDHLAWSSDSDSSATSVPYLSDISRAYRNYNLKSEFHTVACVAQYSNLPNHFHSNESIDLWCYREYVKILKSDAGGKMWTAQNTPSCAQQENRFPPTVGDLGYYTN